MSQPPQKISSMEGGVKACGDVVLLNFWCGFAEIVILSCGIAVLQKPSGLQYLELLGNFNVVCGFLIILLFCVVFIHNSMHFCSIPTPLMPPSSLTSIKERNCFG